MLFGNIFSIYGLTVTHGLSHDPSTKMTTFVCLGLKKREKEKLSPTNVFSMKLSISPLDDSWHFLHSDFAT